MKVLAVIVVTLLLTVTLPMVRSVASEDSNEEIVRGPIYKSWFTYLRIDTFFGNEIERVAYHPQIREGEEKGLVNYKCVNGSLQFHAVTMPIPSIDEIGYLIKTDVFIKVDDGPIIETFSEYPIIVIDPDTVIKVRDLFRTGSEAKIRTVHHKYNKFTYTLDLEGFNDASKWVEDGCPD